jgi:hypothetical protein
MEMPKESRFLEREEKVLIKEIAGLIFFCIVCRFYVQNIAWRRRKE